jgi:hypothetical protein
MTVPSLGTFPALPITCLLGGYRTFGTKIGYAAVLFQNASWKFSCHVRGSLSWSARLVWFVVAGLGCYTLSAG